MLHQKYRHSYTSTAHAWITPPLKEFRIYGSLFFHSDLDKWEETAKKAMARLILCAVIEWIICL